MNFNYDHESFVRKNKSFERSYSLDQHDNSMEKKGFSRQKREEDASCFNCKLKKKCSEFRVKRSGGAVGAASFTGNEKFICDRYSPAPPDNKTMNDKQIKSLLKNIRKMR